MKIETFKRTSGIISKHRKENSFHWQYTFISKDLEDVIVCRFYETKARVYCCLWVHGGVDSNGSGQSGGYGYQGRSESLAITLFSAGYITTDIINDGSPEAICAIIATLAKYHGWTGKVFHSHP